VASRSISQVGRNDGRLRAPGGNGSVLDRAKSGSHAESQTDKFWYCCHMTGAAKLIVFEGPDGVGKSTLAAATMESLTNRGCAVEGLSFPGKTPGTLGWVIDQIHHGQRSDDLSGLTPLSLQALHIAAHLDHIESRIRPALAQGTTILLDRSWWSTWVYGCAASVQLDVLEKLIEAEKAAWAPVFPDQVFLINRTTPFRREQDERGFARLSGFYAELADRESGRYPVTIIANDSIDESMGIIRDRLDALFDPRDERLARKS
jgi:thymidylate kinase